MRLKGFLMTFASSIAGTFEPNILLFDVLPMTSTILSAPRYWPQAVSAWTM